MSKQYIRLFRVAVLVMVCMVAGVGSALAQSVTIDADETRTTTITASTADNIVIINGIITTSGNDNDGIFSGGARAEIINSGAISTTGMAAHGISVVGIVPEGATNAMITNSGAISTMGMAAHGIFSQGTETTITNNGAITTSGDGAHGIFAEGDRTEVTISGSVSVSGTGSFAVRGSDAGDQTLNLHQRARLFGRVDLGVDGNDVVNLLVTGGPSATYSIEGAEEINLLGSAPVIRDGGGTVAVIDPTGSSAERMVLGSSAGQIRRLVFQRLAFARQSAGMGGGASGGSGWGTFFGAGHERDADGLALAWSGSRFGAVGGYDIRLDSGQRVGLFAGGSRGHIETDIRSIETDTNSGFIGVYGAADSGGGRP